MRLGGGKEKGQQGRRRTWTFFVLALLTNFACIFVSAWLALNMGPADSVAASMLPQRQADYSAGADTPFAPLDPDVAAAAATDAAQLRLTPGVEVNETPVIISTLPPPPTATATATMTPPATATRSTPTPSATATRRPTLTPSPTPQATAAASPDATPAETAAPATATRPPATATRTPTRVTPTNTPLPTFTPTPVPPTATSPPPPTNTPAPPPTNTPAPPPTNTAVPSPTNTPFLTITPLIPGTPDPGS